VIFDLSQSPIKLALKIHHLISDYYEHRQLLVSQVFLIVKREQQQNEKLSEMWNNQVAIQTIIVYLVNVD